MRSFGIAGPRQNFTPVPNFCQTRSPRVAVRSVHVCVRTSRPHSFPLFIPKLHRPLAFSLVLSLSLFFLSPSLPFLFFLLRLGFGFGSLYSLRGCEEAERSQEAATDLAGGIMMGSSSVMTTINSTFQDLEKQSTLITTCTLLWKDLSAHFSNLEQSLLSKSQSLHHKFLALDDTTQQSLQILSQRELSIGSAVDAALSKLDERKQAALLALAASDSNSNSPKRDASAAAEADFLKLLQSFCTKMDFEAFWKFLTARKKDVDAIRPLIPPALSDCIDPATFALEAISGVFPVDKRANKNERTNEVGWACVLVLESLVPVLADPVLGSVRPLVTPSVKERAKEIAVVWKEGFDQRGGVENVKAPDAHTFLQHVVTFGVVCKEDEELYRKLVIAFAWRKQMPRLAISLGLKDKMAGMLFDF